MFSKLFYNVKFKILIIYYSNNGILSILLKYIQDILVVYDVINKISSKNWIKDIYIYIKL